MPFLTFRSLPALCLLIVLSAAAHGAEEPAMIEAVDDALVKQVSDIVVGSIEIGDCSGSPCSPATVIEKIDGILPREMTRQLIIRGAGSAFAEFCQLDWGAGSYLPLMEREQNSGCWSERQIAAVSVTHGVAMSLYRNSLTAEVTECTPSLKSVVDQYLLALRNHTKRLDCPRW